MSGLDEAAENFCICQRSNTFGSRNSPGLAFHTHSPSVPLPLSWSAIRNTFYAVRGNVNFINFPQFLYMLSWVLVARKMNFYFHYILVFISLSSANNRNTCYTSFMKMWFLLYFLYISSFCLKGNELSLPLYSSSLSSISLSSISLSSLSLSSLSLSSLSLSSISLSSLLLSSLSLSSLSLSSFSPLSYSLLSFSLFSFSLFSFYLFSFSLFSFSFSLFPFSLSSLSFFLFSFFLFYFSRFLFSYKS